MSQTLQQEQAALIADLQQEQKRRQERAIELATASAAPQAAVALPLLPLLLLLPAPRVLALVHTSISALLWLLVRAASCLHSCLRSSSVGLAYGADSSKPATVANAPGGERFGDSTLDLSAHCGSDNSTEFQLGEDGMLPSWEVGFRTVPNLEPSSTRRGPDPAKARRRAGGRRRRRRRTSASWQRGRRTARLA